MSDQNIGLAGFLRADYEKILAEWMDAVRCLPAAQHLSPDRLKDHLPGLLQCIAQALERDSPLDLGRLQERPVQHALQRLDSGFSVEAVAAEYAALRACIFRLCAERHVTLSAIEITRLNLTIDQAIIQAIDQHARARERALVGLESLSVAALSQQSVDQLLPKMLHILGETTEAVDSAALFLRDGDALRLRAAIGSLEEEVAKGLRLALDAGFVGHVATHGPLEWHAWEPRRDGVILRGQAKVAYGIPLLQMNTVVGIGVIESDTAGEFSREDKLYFRTMIDRIGALIEQSRLQQLLAASEDRLRVATDAADLGIWEYRPATGELRFSDRCKTLFGLSADGSIDLETFLARVHPDDRAHVRQTVQGICAGAAGSTHAMEYRLHWPDGSEHWLEVHCTIGRDFYDQALRLIGTAVDISARKGHEAEQARQAEFERHLIGIVSHDLRNPLSAIAMAAESLSRRPSENPRQARQVHRIRLSAARANRMIHDLMDFTRAHVGGGVDLEPTLCDLDDVARQAVAEVTLAHPNGKISLECEGVGRGVWDGDRLTQLMINLLANALEHSPADSTVHMTTRPIDGDWVAVEIHNAGASIAADDLPHLFSPFSRSHHARPAKAGGGLGLGLYISQAIARAHGGRISVHSTPTEGTLFTVVLPRRTPTTAGDAEPGGAEPPGPFNVNA